MGDRDERTGSSGTGTGPSKTADRAARQAEALRANLSRRKQQSRDRAAPPPRPIKNPERQP